MHQINPRIYERKYRKTRNPYWLVKCQLPAPTPEIPEKKKAYQKKHATRAEAEQDRMRLIRESGGGSVSTDQLKDFEAAQHRLNTCAGDARGKTALFAIEWFIRKFVDTTKTPLVQEAVHLFLTEHVVGLREKSRDEYDQYLTRLVDRFGGSRIGDISTEILQNFVDAHPAKTHHRKCLIGLFAFCSGGSKKIMSRHQWLDRNPAKHIKVPVDETDKEIVILTLEEVRNTLALALMVGDLPYWIWGLFTGMRPEETKKFWTLEGYGWNRINLNGGFIVVNREIAKDKRRRKIIIRPALRAWLDYFKATEERMFPTCHRLKFRAIKRDALTDEKFGVNDLLRHTYISFRVHAFDKSLATTASESGNSERIIRDHYLDLIPDLSTVDMFWELTPASFGLIAPPSAPDQPVP